MSEPRNYRLRSKPSAWLACVYERFECGKARAAHTAHTGSGEHAGWEELTVDGSGALYHGGTACVESSESLESVYVLPAGSYYLGGNITTGKPIVIQAGTVELCLKLKRILDCNIIHEAFLRSGKRRRRRGAAAPQRRRLHLDGCRRPRGWAYGRQILYFVVRLAVKNSAADSSTILVTSG